MNGILNQDTWYPVILTNATDFKTAVIGKVYSDITCKYFKTGDTSQTSFSVTSSNWKEAGEGKYSIKIGATEWTNQAIYQVSISCSGCIVYNFPVDTQSFTLISNDVGSVQSSIDSLSADVGSVLSAVDSRASQTSVNNVSADVGTVLSDVSAIQTVLNGITSLAKWLRGLYRKDTMDATAKSEINYSGGTYNEATDSNEAIAEIPGGLTAQQTRDAMKLAPTPGLVALGSIDYDLGSISADILEIPTDTASQSSIDSLSADVSNVHSDVGTVLSAVNTKSSQASIDSLSADVSEIPTNTASQSSVNSLSADVLSISSDLNTVMTQTNKLEFTDNSGHNEIRSDIKMINGNATDADKLSKSVSSIVIGTVTNSVTTPSVNEFDVSDISASANDFYKDRVIIFVTGNLAGQGQVILGYEFTSVGHFVTDDFTSAPTSGDKFVIV
jgi:hypothetical protein